MRTRVLGIGARASESGIESEVLRLHQSEQCKFETQGELQCLCDGVTRSEL